MLKSIRIFAAAAALSLLGACATNLPGSLDVNSIITATQRACAFVPTASTVARIIASLTGGEAIVTTAADVAKEMCDALAAAPKGFTRRGGVVVRAKWRGRVPIEGSFVR